MNSVLRLSALNSWGGVQRVTASCLNKPLPCPRSDNVYYIKFHNLLLTVSSEVSPATRATVPRQRAHLELGIRHIQAQF
jgi:hypothetical protein